MAGLPVTPLFFDGNDEKTKNLLQQLAHSIAGDKVAEAGNDVRVRIHIAAVFAGNFTNFMYVLAEQYCRAENLDFSLLYPLIEETALRIQSVSPGEVQTGPAIRHDADTIKKHLDLLQAHPQLQKIYAFLSDRIGQMT
jgi:predicted short-subunit dehydrogenase-like oxidoreductase (DUF2520 family)